MDLLLDTNVLLDHFGNRLTFAKDANMVLAMGLFGDVRLWAVPQSFNDMFYILRKVVDSASIQKSFEKIYRFVNVCTIDSADMKLAAERGWNDMEDCFIAICAEKIGARYIVTRDASGFASSKVAPIAPDRLVELMKNERGICYDEVGL